MRLNQLGQAVMGRTMVSVDTVVPPQLAGIDAGNPQWLMPHVLICQALVGDYRLVTLDVADPHAQLQVVSAHGQNYLFAGGGVWARYLGGSGYLDSYGRTDATAAPVAVDDLTGHIAVAVANGERFQVWNEYGVLVDLGPHPDSWQPNDIDFHDGVLAFRRGGQVVTYPPRPFAPVPGQGVRLAGGAVLAYQHGRGMVVYPETSVIGMALHLDPKDGDNDFSPDMVAQPDGTLLVVSSHGEGELPHELQRYVIDLARLTVNGESRPAEDLSQPRIPPGPEPPDPGPNPEPPNPEPPPMATRGYLRNLSGEPWMASRYLCVDPASPDTVEMRESAGAWEEVEVFAIPGFGYTIQFVAARVFFCLTPDGDWETRPSAGAWETFIIAEQPPDWTHRLVFRVGEDGQVIDVLVFEEKR